MMSVVETVSEELRRVTEENLITQKAVPSGRDSLRIRQQPARPSGRGTEDDTRVGPDGTCILYRKLGQYKSED